MVENGTTTGSQKDLYDAYIGGIENLYSPLHPSLYTNTDINQIIDPTVLHWLAHDQPCTPDGVPTCCTIHSPGIYSFSLFTSEISQLWTEELSNIE